jgi:hypothetical protein
MPTIDVTIEEKWPGVGLTTERLLKEPSGAGGSPCFDPATARAEPVVEMEASSQKGPFEVLNGQAAGGEVMGPTVAMNDVGDRRSEQVAFVFEVGKHRRRVIDASDGVTKFAQWLGQTAGPAAEIKDVGSRWDPVMHQLGFTRWRESGVHVDGTGVPRDLAWTFTPRIHDLASFYCDRRGLIPRARARLAT